MLLICVLLLSSHYEMALSEVPVLGPMLTSQPPPAVDVGPNGARLPCSARGQPAPRVSWQTNDGTPVTDEPGVRRVLPDGTLQILRVQGPRELRCRAASARGVVLSRLVTLQPADTGWEVVVQAGAMAAGGVAALRCVASNAASQVSVPARAALWYRGDRLLDITSPQPGSRYLTTGNTLLIRDVSAADAGDYSCVARHSLTDLTKRSRPARLSVITGSSNAAPRLLSPAGAMSVPLGADFCLPCVATDYPQPHYTWYRESQGRLVALEAGGSRWLWAGGAALCEQSATLEVAGAWLCKAYNVFGDATAQLRVYIDAPLNVSVSPAVVVAEPGSTVVLNCSSNAGATLSWLHDGRPVTAGPTGVVSTRGADTSRSRAGATLVLRGATRSHRGMYQCVARSGPQEELATAELRLGDSLPELQYTFIEQALRGGGSAALRCAASASPPPRITWLLDGQPLEQFLPHHRYMVSEETSLHGDTVSVLNISAVSTADGGRYTCRAHNALGAVDHSARLNVYGPPSVRALGPLRAVAGDNFTVHCPYAGYPISAVSWWRGGQTIEGAGRVTARGDALLLLPALARDAGRYACAVAAPSGPVARRDFDLQVRNPPKISPFMFSSELTEGSSVQVLCGVSSGDKPMYFSWMKDGAPLPADLQIEEKSLNEFSLLMFSELSARHSGRYTCRVTNHAATVNYTAILSVKVAPLWVTEPLDLAVLLGAPLLLQCTARGHPTPIVTWYRRIGIGGGAETSDRWEATGAEWSDAGAEMTTVAKTGITVGADDVGSAVLNARGAARSHQGVYRCAADNGVGPALIKTVNVTVHEPAHFAPLSEEARNLSSVRGSPVTLACLALGDAPLTVHWTHRGIKLDLDSFRWTISEARSGEGLRSLLRLRAAEREDAGEYRCLAHNRFGHSDQVLFLHIEEPPEAPRAVRLGGAGSSWVRVAWRSRDDLQLGHNSHGSSSRHQSTRFSALCTPLHALPVPSDIALALNLTLDPVEDDRPDPQGYRLLSAKVTGLRPAAAYSLRLIASNHVGQSPHSEPLLFTTLEEAPSGPPQNIHVKPANIGELHVSWSAPPQHTWNGELLGYALSWRELSRLEEDSDEEESEARTGTIVAPGWSSADAILAGLREFTRYAVSVRAYNRAGASPASPPIYTTTADGVPESAPSAVTCEAEGSRSLRVRWSPPRPTPASLHGYDLTYSALHVSHVWSGAVEPQTLTVAGTEAALQGLQPATNYSARVRARTERGPGPNSRPVYCITKDDVPGAVAAVRALPAGADAVRVAWLPPAQRSGRLTHYTVHIRELAKAGGEWSQRAEAGTEAGAEDEMALEVRGLTRGAFEFRVRAHSAAGAGPKSRAATAAAAPAHSPVPARISSFTRMVSVAWGARVRLKCDAVGTPPLTRRWSPLPPAHTITDTGDLIIHKVEQQWATNYTCAVRNSAGADRVQFALALRRPPAAPTPRLVRADTHALHLAWDPPATHSEPVLGYSMWWWVGWEGGGEARGMRTAGVAAALRGLACGTRYRISLRAHSVAGVSPHSRPLLLRTRGDKAKAPPGKELIWANSTTLRLNLLTWGGRCPVAAWTLALRRAADSWRELLTDGEFAEAGNLQPGTWYEIRVVARSTAGDTTALYRAATHTLNGERIGEPMELPLEAGASIADEGVRSVSGGEAGRGTAWHGAAGAALAGTALALLAAGVALTRARCRLARHAQASPQTKGKKLSPPDGDLQEISPYATFSMSSATGGTCSATANSGGAGVPGGGVRSCALHLHSFSRAESLDLAAPPPRPHFGTHSSDYGRTRDSDSESSGSPCAACAAELYRIPAARLADTLPAAESSAEEQYGVRRPPARSRRREHSRAPLPTVRYFSPAALQARREAL